MPERPGATPAVQVGLGQFPLRRVATPAVGDGLRQRTALAERSGACLLSTPLSVPSKYPNHIESQAFSVAKLAEMR